MVYIFFGVRNFDAKYFFRPKISASCIFFGLQYEASLEPPAMYAVSTPPGDYTMKETKTKTSVTDIFSVVHENNRVNRSMIMRKHLI